VVPVLLPVLIHLQPVLILQLWVVMTLAVVTIWESAETQAKVVRGKYVRIGRGCEIDRVEYSEDLTIDGGTVKEQTRV